MNVNVYASGWCTVCGRRRGGDGRCVNCDPWWTSPLIQIGGPILAIGSLLIVGLAIAVTPPPRDPAGTSASPGNITRPTSPLFTPPNVGGSFGPGAISLSSPALQTATSAPPLAAMPTLPPEFYGPKPDPDAAMMENFDWLRYRVRVASNQMRTQSDSPPRRENINPMFSPRTPNFTESARPAL